MSQQSLFIADGGGSNNTASVTAANQPDGGFSLQNLVARYNSVSPTIGDGYLSFLQVDVNGNLKTTASVSFTYVANPGSAVPTQTAWIGASDGTNLRGLLVESSTASNLRTSLYYGATEMKIGLDGYTAVHQADSPWVVSGTVTANQGTSPWVTSVSGTVAVTQSTSPWVVSGTVAATQSGTWTVQQGTPPWTVTGTYATNVAAGSDAVKGLVGQYNSAAPTVTNGNLTYLQTDVNGRLLTTATLSPSFVAPDNAALPPDAAWIGASDGTNLQGLEVESATFANLKTGLWDGANKLAIGSANAAAGNGAHAMPAQYHATLTTVTDTNVTYAQADGYGRLEVNGARAVAYKFENTANHTVTLKVGSGVFRKFIVGDAGVTGSLITFYDNTAGSGTVIAAINGSNINGQLEFDIAFTTGLTYVVNNKNPGSITITYE